MLQSMNSGVAGMKASNQELNVISNNISNSQTTAFKSSSVTFEDMYYQSVQGSSSPTTSSGGTNPTQFGTGVKVQGINKDMGYGGLSSTSNPLDLVIAGGTNFFIVSKGNKVYDDTSIQIDQTSNSTAATPSHTIKSNQSGDQLMYTQDGSFGKDPDGSITLNGYRLMGYSVVGSQVALSPNSAAYAAAKGAAATAATAATNADTAAAAADTLATNSDTAAAPFDATAATADAAAKAADSTAAADVTAAAVAVANAATAQTNSTNAITADTAAAKVLSDATATNAAGSTAATLAAVTAATTAKATTAAAVTAAAAALTAANTAVTTANAAVTATTAAATAARTTANTADAAAVAPDAAATAAHAAATTAHTAATNAHTAASAATAVIAQSLDANGNVSFVDGGKTVYANDTSLKTLKIPETVNEGTDKDPINVAVSSWSVDSNGVVNVTLADSKVAAIGQVALAKFTNDTGLNQVGNNMFSVSANSGSAILDSGVNTSGDNNSGSFSTIQGSALEQSNVDLATEFTKMIEASRAFEANGKIITTGDTILQTIINLKQ